ncbi:pumilio 7 [Striga asiatica]|uniref:Pumilio 7 n=1 Tax=Striga asiatica TaxID=4170 RepID=A0A5A7QBX8_STRAF|nr:pumilio 7 [Striga asiatica]
MKNDDEFERLLGEIPHATASPLNHHHTLGDAHHQRHANLVDHHGYGHASCVSRRVSGHAHPMCDDDLLRHKYASVSSPVSGFSLQSDGSSSSLFSGGGGISLSNIEPPSPPQIEILNSHLIPANGFWLDFKKDNDDVNFLDDFHLSGNFSKMCISDEPDYGLEFINSVQSRNRALNGASLLNLENYGAFDNYRKSFTDSNHLPVPRETPMNLSSIMVEMQNDPRCANLLGSPYSPSRPESPYNRPEFSSSQLNPRFYRANGNGNFPVGLFMPEVSPSSLNRLPATATDPFYMPSVVQLARLSRHCDDENNLLHHHPSVLNVRNRVPRRSLEPFTRDDSLIIQGESGTDYCTNSGHVRSRGQNNTRSLHHEQKTLFSCSSLSSGCSLAEIRGYIYYIAKDQHGCRFLQKMFDEGTLRDVQIVFEEIIDHVVELMMNPFGNYLMQKLLEVCTEEQRMHILLRVTEESGELVRISLNTHGTRVVQKLIETLKTRQQISIVVSALEPGFLALIKDLNGNHVVQRCLQCFSAEDSKFIFVAAARYCVDIATHQHGCCVLQRCISQATGELRENLVDEISANGLLLAQDAYGNYVVQFILELKVPSATSKLISQFEGHYVHLARQKFSSHVVEKCLVLCNEGIRSKIIHELLSASYFEQLLQDPHANYVIQTALRVTEGRLHYSLVEAIESYKAISRNSPYSKRIFSQKLLKR